MVKTKEVNRVMHVKKKEPIRTLPDFTRYGFTIRERERSWNERKNRPL